MRQIHGSLKSSSLTITTRLLAQVPKLCKLMVQPVLLTLSIGFQSHMEA